MATSRSAFWLAVAVCLAVVLGVVVARPDNAARARESVELFDELGLADLYQPVSNAGEAVASAEIAYALPPGTTPGDVRRRLAHVLGDAWRAPSESCDGFTRGHDLVIARADVFESSILNLHVAARGAGDCMTYESTLAS